MHKISMTKQTAINLVYGTIIAVVAFFLLQALNENDRKTREGVDKIQACITAEAHTAGYTGNVHGLDAWKLFGGNCIK